MIRRLVPMLIILVALISLGSLFYIVVPQNVTSTHSTSSMFTSVNWEMFLDYSTSTVRCTGTPPICYDQVFPYTYTETWSATTAHVALVLSTSTSHVPYAISGTLGGIAVVVVLVFLFTGVVLFARDRQHGNSRAL